MDNFIKIKEFRDGHAYYVERESGRITVADMGRFGRFDQDLGPTNTDDGVLYLDFTREVKGGVDRHRNKKFWVPLTPDRVNESTHMVVSEIERLWIEQTFNW